MDRLTCHTKEDMMGDGDAYSVLLEEGAIDAPCEVCHATLTENPNHLAHLAVDRKLAI